jgi:glycosyltransferase involved in cell wall biosynthesis
MNMKIVENEIKTPKTTKLARVAICVITCFRPDGLRRLLEGLASQKFTKNARPDMRIAIVDNDAEGSARMVCDRFIAQHELKLEYEIEKQRGIPFARNHAIDMVKNEVDYIAILDDDEVPAENWLDELMATQQEFEADIITGPVAAYFMEPPANWLTDFYGLGNLPNGNLPNGQHLFNNYEYVYTSNLLAKAELFQHVRFEERFRSNGADDTYLFMQLYAKGYKAVWADNALVTEWVPPSRMNPKWLWKRAYRRGNGFAFCELVHNPSLATKIQRIVKGIFRFIQGVVTVIFCFGRKATFVRGVQTACIGIGMIAGTLGVEYQEYKTIHRV